MRRYHVRPLPNWVLTNIQSAFYDSESGTILQQMARVYSKIEELINTYNDFVREINRYIDEFEDGIIKDFECFKNCIIKTMNDYIETIDTKINLQDLKIKNKFDSQDEVIQNAVDYMKDNLVSTLTTLFNQALQNGDIQVNLVTNYTEETESLVLSLVAESESE